VTSELRYGGIPVALCVTLSLGHSHVHLGAFLFQVRVCSTGWLFASNVMGFCSLCTVCERLGSVHARYSSLLSLHN